MILDNLNRNKTISELKKFEIDFIGGGIDFDEAYKTKVVEKNSLKIGLIAACENEFGCLYENQERGGYAWLFMMLSKIILKI